MSEKLKVCAHCEVPKPISEFTRNKVNLKWGAKDGLSIYCKACNYSGKSLRNHKKPKPVEQPQFASANRGVVLRAVEKGHHSREQIELFTGLDMEEVVDILAHLAFEKQKLRLVKVDDDWEFHIAA